MTQLTKNEQPMPPTDAVNVVKEATSVSWEAGLLALLVLVLIGLVSFHYRSMWSHIQRMSVDHQAIVDDNTLAWLQVARAFGHCNCITDSDCVKVLRKDGLKAEDFGEHSDTARRVLDRREKRKADNVKQV